MSNGLVKVLLIEDDEDDFVLTRQLLRQIGDDCFILDWVQQYEEGLERLARPGYDVCLVDYRLGQRNGVELLSQAVIGGCDVPIILLTGQGDHEIDMAAMQAGAADFLPKKQLTAALLERSIRYSIQHKRTEEHRLKLLAEQVARSQAEAANKAKDQFMAALSHELRTPLTPVLMTLAAMKKDPDLPSRFAADIEMMRRNVALEARLIDDLLDLTRVSRGKLELHWENTDAHALLGHALKTCCQGNLYSNRVEVNLHTKADNHHVYADPARLEQVFWNLIQNALKFTPDGGRIDIRTWNLDRIQGPDDPGGPVRSLLIAITDTGIGIDPAALPRIFAAFEQADRAITSKFGGLGLGLAICRAIVDAHGGTISAQSPGKNGGATFTVELPSVSPQPVTSPTAGLAHAGVSQPTPHHNQHDRVLLVEDHADTARILSQLLRADGFTVRTAADVASALELAAGERFTLVISDLGLPDGNGHDLMRKLRQLQPRLPGIALSGYGMEDDIQKSLDAGFRMHLTKPVNLAKLEAAIALLIK